MEIINTIDMTVPKMLTIRQTAATGILPEYALRQLVKEKKIPAIFSGNKAFVNYTQLVNLLNNLTVEGEAHE